MATILVDGVEIEVDDRERLNVIQAADRAGISIPFYCWHPGLSVVASCRMCLVETGTKNKETGEIAMIPKLVPACQTPAKDGTVVVTNSPRVKANQNFVQEGILLDHPVDCPICDQAGECWLQDYYFEYGHKERRADVRPFTSERRDLGPHVSLFADRCVMCSRCVRFTREVSGEGELMVVDRGSHAEIDVFPGFPIDNSLSGNVNDICPVGALCSSDFLYQQRVWFLDAQNTICTGCSTGCATQMHVNQNTLYRVQPRYNPNANDWWMCDKGRYENGYLTAPNRLDAPRIRKGDKFEPLEWSEAIREIYNHVADVALHHGGRRLAVVVSPFLTCEEAYLLSKWAKGILADVVLAVGPAPVRGTDEVFKAGFTIRAEKCPNRVGVTEIVKHFSGGQVLDWNGLLTRVAAGDFLGAYVTGNAPFDWISDAEAETFAKLDKLVVQDIFPSPLARKAHVVIPGAASFEKEGAYVNHAGLIQSTQWGVRPPGAAHMDGQTFGDLLGRRGLYQSAAVMAELAAEIPFFARCAGGIPPAGLNLVTGQEKQPKTTELGTVTHPTPTFRSEASRMLEVEPQVR